MDISYIKKIVSLCMISVILIINGCDEPLPPDHTPKTKVKEECFKVRTLPHIKTREVNFQQIRVDFNTTDEPDKIIVSKSKIRKASRQSQKKSIVIKKLIKYIKFYEYQNIKIKEDCKNKLKKNKKKGA